MRARLLRIFVIFSIGLTGCGPNYDGKYLSRNASPGVMVDLKRQEVVCFSTHPTPVSGRFDLEGDSKSLWIKLQFFSCEPSDSTLYYRLRFSEITNCNDRPAMLLVSHGETAIEMDSADACKL